MVQAAETVVAVEELARFGGLFVCTQPVLRGRVIGRSVIEICQSADERFFLSLSAKSPPTLTQCSKGIGKAS